MLTEKSSQALQPYFKAFSLSHDAMRIATYYCYPKEVHLYFCKFYQPSSEEGLAYENDQVIGIRISGFSSGNGIGGLRKTT